MEQNRTFPETGLSPEEQRFLQDLQKRIPPPLVPDWNRRNQPPEIIKTLDQILKEVGHV